MHFLIYFHKINYFSVVLSHDLDLMSIIKSGSCCETSLELITSQDLLQYMIHVCLKYALHIF